MTALIVLLLLVALVSGGFGVANGLWWLLVIAAVLFVVSGFTGFYGRGHHH